MARNVRPLWISNLIAADLTRSGAELVANMAEVSEVGLDEPLTLQQGRRERARAEYRRACRTRPREDARARGLAAGISRRRPPARRARRRCECRSSRAFAALARPHRRRELKAGTIPPAASARLPAAPKAPTLPDCSAVSMRARAIRSAWLPPPRGLPPNSSAKPRRGCPICLPHSSGWPIPTAIRRTLADVPDAVCNSWGLDAACAGGAPAAVWEALENFEALGPVLIFAGRRRRPGCGLRARSRGASRLLCRGQCGCGRRCARAARRLGPRPLALRSRAHQARCRRPRHATAYLRGHRLRARHVARVPPPPISQVR